VLRSPAAAEALTALAPLCTAKGWRWFVFGAQAVDVWGQPRLSADVDVTIEIPGEPAGILPELEASGFDLREGVDVDFIGRTRALPLLHRSTGMPLDLILAGPGLEQEFLERAIPIELGGLAIPFISPEDLLVTKILAGRPKDVEDVRGILRTRGRKLDLGRVRSSLDLLQQALSRSDLLPLLEAQILESL